MSSNELECWEAPAEVDAQITEHALNESRAVVPLSMPLADIASALARRAEYWASEVDAVEAKYKRVIEAYNAERAFAEKRQEAAKRLIMSYFRPSPEAELVTDHVRLYYKETERLQVNDASAIPIDYVKYVEEIDNAKIKADLKSGTEVPGAVLEIKYHLQIAPGGLRGKENAKQRQKRKAKQIDQ